MRKLNKLTAAVTLFCFTVLLPVRSYAVVPFVPVVVGALTAGALVTTIGALKYYKPSVANDNRAYVDTFHSVARIVQATGKIVNQYGVEQYYQQKQALSMTYNQIKDYVTAHKPDFPTLFAAFYEAPTGGEMHPVSVGDRVQINGKQYIIDSMSYNVHTWNNPLGHPTYECQWSNTASAFCYVYDYQVGEGNSASGYLGWQQGTWHEVEPTQLERPADSTTNMLTQGVTSALYPPIVIEPMRNEYLDEFDHLLDSNNSAVTIVSAEDLDKNKATTIPPVWPATINDPQAINPVQDKTAQVVDGLKTYEQQMADRLTSAIAIRDAYWSGSPGSTTVNDPRLAQLQNDVAAAAAAQTLAATQVKQAEADQAQADAEAATAAPAVPDAGIYDSVLEIPVLKPITTLLTTFVSNSPLTVMLRSFNIATGSTSCTVSCGTIYGRELEFSFCRYTEDFAKLGAFLLVVSHGFAVLVVIRGWREN